MKTHTKHTPGPWIAYNADNGRIFKHWRVRGGSVRNEPAFCEINSKGKILPEYEAANARLIASAPELLEALKQAEKYIRFVSEKFSDAEMEKNFRKHGAIKWCRQFHDGARYRAEEVRAAIEKAEGN